VFSGIVKSIGRIAEIADHGADRRLVITYDGASLGRLEIGGSIAVNGVCLTATSDAASRFAADVSAETLAVTTLGRLAVGVRVNLEPPLKAGEPLDGHIVQGHVDGTGRVVALKPAGRSTELTIELPADLVRYVAPKGSIAVDGVSLTVNSIRERQFTVNIIPHTQAVTVIGEYRSGTAVNIEVDLVARYLERLVRSDGEADDARGVDLGLLKKHGYARND
jgi:riboflavin synthase